MVNNVAKGNDFSDGHNYVKSRHSDRWDGIIRPYSLEDVAKHRGSLRIEYTLASKGAEDLWEMMKDGYVRAMGALTGMQAKQMVQAGLRAIYASGWQVAADANKNRHVYPDQSLYDASSMSDLVMKINNALRRADQVEVMGKGMASRDWYAPIVADAEAGFGGNLNAMEIMLSLIEAGAAAIHYEDQLSSAKKCGHMGGKVLVPTREHIKKLVAARLASDIANVPTILIARTDANGAQLLTSDIDPLDAPFIDTKQGRTEEGFYHFKGGLEAGIARGLAFAPYADMLWLETSTPNISEARRFAEAMHDKFPGKKLAYNCSPSFNWKANLNDKEIETFQDTLGEMGYTFQFITLAGFHSLNEGMFSLAIGYASQGMPAFVDLQEREFASQKKGFSAVKHQAEVGAGYFDSLQKTVSRDTLTIAMKGSTEEEQFH